MVSASDQFLVFLRRLLLRFLLDPLALFAYSAGSARLLLIFQLLLFAVGFLFLCSSRLTGYWVSLPHKQK